MLMTLLLALSLTSPVSSRMVADTTKGAPRPAPASTARPAPTSKPSKPAPKPVGDPVLKRRHPGG